MKVKTTLLLLGVALACGTAQAQGLVINTVAVNPDFSTTLSDFTNPANILALDPQTGATYAAGQFGFSGGGFQVLNLTNTIPDPSSGFADPTYNIASDVTFDNLLLNETFSDGFNQNVSLFDLSNPGAPVTSLDTGTLFLESDAQAVPDPAHGGLRLATLSGNFNTGDPANPNGTVNIQVASVPEPGGLPLLLVGLALTGPLLRARLRSRVKKDMLS